MVTGNKECGVYSWYEMFPTAPWSSLWWQGPAEATMLSCQGTADDTSCVWPPQHYLGHLPHGSELPQWHLLKTPQPTGRFKTAFAHISLARQQTVSGFLQSCKFSDSITKASSHFVGMMKQQNMAECNRAFPGRLWEVKKEVRSCGIFFNFEKWHFSYIHSSNLQCGPKVGFPTFLHFQ